MARRACVALGALEVSPAGLSVARRACRAREVSKARAARVSVARAASVARKAPLALACGGRPGLPAHRRREEAEADARVRLATHTVSQVLLGA